jgi:hypothetical protein
VIAKLLVLKDAPDHVIVAHVQQGNRVKKFMR